MHLINVKWFNLQSFWIWIPTKVGYSIFICRTWYMIWRMKWITNINPILSPLFMAIAFDAFTCSVVEKTCIQWRKYFLSTVQGDWNLPKIVLIVIFSTPTPKVKKLGFISVRLWNAEWLKKHCDIHCRRLTHFYNVCHSTHNHLLTWIWLGDISLNLH